MTDKEYKNAKLLKLVVHQRTFCAEDLIISPREHANIKKGDIVEIYHPEDGGTRLLLQVTNFNEEKQYQDIISVESSVALAFNLRTREHVYVNIIDSNSPRYESVVLDSVEITFKDQYMGRSEMWRLKTHLTNSCVYLNKKIEYCEGSLRCQIYEMWKSGDRVTCGVINDDTKVVFRSSTSCLYLFLQLSSEMWDFDIFGDLYFEKACNGFLADLFMKWKKLASNHEVTIVLFSRTFYAAKSLDEFPPHMRECLQLDYKGRFYEDFYRVAIQNERNDDWSSVLVQLRKLFTSYQDTVLRYHERPGLKIPPATNSTAAQGNFLEVLNISLNVFEKHYLDRNFDRTGQLSVVITPGVGVFEVDRELTNVTKQRIIDNGVGSDLVCVGEQPLHAVPLLKFHNKDSSLTSVELSNDYSMPHWINLSFYSTNKKVAYSTFIPRIKLPPLISSQQSTKNKDKEPLKFINDNQTEYIHNSLFDYDAYDAQIFQLPTAYVSCSMQRVPRTKKTSVPSFGTYISHEWETSTPVRNLRRKMSDPDIHHHFAGGLSQSSSSNTSESTNSAANKSERSPRTVSGSGGSNGNNNSGSILRTGRALINPFDPSHVTIKLTSNRRRWTHIFPKGPTGVLIQQHHYQAIPTLTTCPTLQNFTDLENGDSEEYAHTSTCAYQFNERSKIEHEMKFVADNYRKKSGMSPVTPASKSLTYLWGATGEQEWTPALTTGVDWKSLTIPACLPITTDYFPDKRSLHNDYVVSDYTLLPELVNGEIAQNRAIYMKPLSTEEVFKELVSQRLAQGFQLIILPEKQCSPPQAPCCGGHFVLRRVPQQEEKKYLLSIGRIFHKISLTGSTITVTRYRPRHPYQNINIDYRYRFHAPNHDNYEVSGVNFTTEKLENFNWNYMDQYICTRGDLVDFQLTESMKYWRYRMYMLPKDDPVMKNIIDNNLQHCDIYTTHSPIVPKKQYIDDFLKFVEVHLNKIRRLNKKLRGSPTASQPSHLTKRRHSTSMVSRPPPPNQHAHKINNTTEKNLFTSSPRSGSKVLERGPSTPRILPIKDISNMNEATATDDNDDGFLVEGKIKATAPLTEIFEAMKNPINGVPFLEPMPSLPSCTFVSYDAVQWLLNRIEGTFNPLEILEAMWKQQMIIHASGDFSKPFIIGYYLYYIVHQDKQSQDYKPPLGDLEAFENEWLEVEIRDPDAFVAPHDVGVPKFLHEDIILQPMDNELYKQTHLEIDITTKSDRTEWGHVRYHCVMKPGHAFELVVQWITASGPIVYDLVYIWSRKAQQCGFQLVPIPADPLAEPFVEKSDPLRGPIFIPLHIDALNQNRMPFEEFRKDSWPDRWQLFQEAIVSRFGFMPCEVETKTGSNRVIHDHQYVHCSGNMFILVPSTNHQLRYRQRLASGAKKPTLLNRIVNPGSGNNSSNNSSLSSTESHDTAIITRHVTGTKNKDSSEWDTRRIGFLWSWNHMIHNKKWKSFVINHSDELFQLRILRDFKDFCANNEDRLVNFWDECWGIKEQKSIRNSVAS